MKYAPAALTEPKIKSTLHQITGLGLCTHLRFKFEEVEFVPTIPVPMAKCGLCKKTWQYNPNQKKFIEA